MIADQSLVIPVWLLVSTAMMPSSLASTSVSNQVDARFDRIEARMDSMDARMDRMEARFDAVDARFEHLEARIDGLVPSMIKAQIVFATVLVAVIVGLAPLFG